jgi:hypothetical protein
MKTITGYQKEKVIEIVNLISFLLVPVFIIGSIWFENMTYFKFATSCLIVYTTGIIVKKWYF